MGLIYGTSLLLVCFGKTEKNELNKKIFLKRLKVQVITELMLKVKEVGKVFY